MKPKNQSEKKTVKEASNEFKNPIDFNKFLKLLNDNKRDTCMIALLNGAIDGKAVIDLKPAQDRCLEREKTYTARYRGDGKGQILVPLIRQFVKDVADTNYSRSMGNNSPKTVGFIRKKNAEEWVSFEGFIDELYTSSVHASFINSDSDTINTFAGSLDSFLHKDMRLVLFCEVKGEVKGEGEGEPSLETIGLDREYVNSIVHLIPMNVALVISGVKDQSGSEIPDEHIWRIEVGDDYLVKNPPEDRNQPLLSDADEGEDALNVLSEVNALADAIAARDMEPPLVVGILGGWGSGKSYVMNLLRHRLLQLRHKDVLDSHEHLNFPYVGHFYFVKFSAWTYAKADLWSSLMHEVLLSLNDQIALEQLEVEPGPQETVCLKRFSRMLSFMEEDLDGKNEFNKEMYEKFIDHLPEKVREITAEIPDPEDDKDVKDISAQIINEIQRNGTGPESLTEYYSERKREYLGLKRAYFELKFRKILSGEAEFTPDVVGMLNRSDTDVKKTLQRLGNDVLWGRLQGLNQRAQEELEKEEQKLLRAKCKLAEQDAKFGEEADLAMHKEHWKTFAETLSGALAKRFKDEVDKAQKNAGLDKHVPFDEALASIGLKQKISDGMGQQTIWVFIFFTLTVSIVTALAGKFTLTGGVSFGVLAGFVEAWGRANRWLKEKVEEFHEFDTKLKVRQHERREALISSYKVETEYQQTVQEVAGLESRIQEFRRKIGLTAGHPTLMDYLSHRLQEGGYEERLGLLHQIQKDMGQLTYWFFKREELSIRDGSVGLGVELESLLFPRGEPRVVLFIDDLDRCPPARVVEVLEAAQLLVKTKLFVVVIAMDVRYITKALEKAYEGVLDRRGAPSGLDYIEKIVQIPYRIRPISEEAMPGYLRSQMQIRDDEAEGIDEGGKQSDEGRPLSAILEPGEGANLIDKAIPQKVMGFEPEEVELIQNAALAVGISPRATKRVVNVMKLIKIIWYRTGQKDVSSDIKKSVVFFITLSSQYAEIMRRVLLEMEDMVSGTNSIAPDISQKLPALLCHIAATWGSNEGRHAEWQFLTSACQDGDLLPKDMTLEMLGASNIGLIRSFSFVGEIDLQPDLPTHQVSLQVQEPVKISQERQKHKPRIRRAMSRRKS